MELTKDEYEKLELAKQTFQKQELTKIQGEFILGRKLTDKTWETYTTAERRKQKHTDDKIYSVKRLFTESKRQTSKPQFTFADVAQHAARKAQRQALRKQVNDFRVAKLFRDNTTSYRIEKVREYKYNKFNTTRSEYKIYGEVDIFQMYNVLEELIHKMTSGLPENVNCRLV